MKKLIFILGLISSFNLFAETIDIGVNGLYDNRQTVYKVVCPSNQPVEGMRAILNDLEIPNRPNTNISLQLTWQDTEAGAIVYDQKQLLLYPDGIYRWVNVQDSDYWMTGATLNKGRYGYYKAYIRKYNATPNAERVVIGFTCPFGNFSVPPASVTKIVNNKPF